MPMLHRTSPGERRPSTINRANTMRRPSKIFMKTFSFAEDIKTGSIKNNAEKSGGESVTPGIGKINQGASMQET